MFRTFNFTQPTVSGLNFSFGDTVSSPYNDFNFTESGYTGEYNFNFGAGKNIYNILKGISNDFTSIWADINASITNGKIYIGSQGYFNVVNISDQTISDWYSETHKGRSNESLEHSDITDINVI
jgi:hypothetical protein